MMDRINPMETENLDSYLPHSSEILNLGSEALSQAISVDGDLIMDFSLESEKAPESVVAPAAQSPDSNKAEEHALALAEIAKMVPDKMAFKIGEVAEIADIKPYVLRYWESEFDALNPQKSAFNQRMYSRRDVETVLLIKRLLYVEKFSIAGAKKKIRDLRKGLKAEKHVAEVKTKLETVSDRLEALIPEIASLKSLFS